MKPHEYLIALACTGLLAGCFAASRESSAEPVSTDASAHQALVHGSVSATLQTAHASECRPLGIPVTLFFGSFFSVDQMIAETATSLSETECVHEQTIAASADQWAVLGYRMMCIGGSDPDLCGAATTRLCSVETLMRWADDHREAVTIPAATIDVQYTLPPQSALASDALTRRTLDEAQTLIDETSQVLMQWSSGQRGCPEEDESQIAATFDRAQDLYEQLADAVQD